MFFNKENCVDKFVDMDKSINFTDKQEKINKKIKNKQNSNPFKFCLKYTKVFGYWEYEI